jgi:hypothetical protein
VALAVPAVGVLADQVTIIQELQVPLILVVAVAVWATDQVQDLQVQVDLV